MSDIIKEVKPCPFCGRMWMSLTSYADGDFAVTCICGSAGPRRERKEDAIAVWNTRDQHLLWNPFRFSIRFPKDVFSVDLRGNLDTFDVATVLQMLAAEDKTGILQIVRDHSKSVICMREGDIIAASDSNGLRLGQILHNNGMISHEKLQNALQMARNSNKLIGEVLLFMGYVNPDTLKTVVHQQVQNAVVELFFRKEGYFEYRDCLISFDEKNIQAINTLEIIMESARKIDERQ